MNPPGEKSTESYDVIPSLMDVLTEAMKSKGRTHDDISTGFRRSDRQLRRYLKGESIPPGNKLDSLVTAVAVVSETNRFKLWSTALATAEAEVEELGLDPRQTAAEAAYSAPRPDSE